MFHGHVMPRELWRVRGGESGVKLDYFSLSPYMNHILASIYGFKEEHYLLFISGRKLQLLQFITHYLTK